MCCCFKMMKPSLWILSPFGFLLTASIVWVFIRTNFPTPWLEPTLAKRTKNQASGGDPSPISRASRGVSNELHASCLAQGTLLIPRGNPSPGASYSAQGHCTNGRRGAQLSQRIYIYIYVYRAVRQASHETCWFPVGNSQAEMVLGSFHFSLPGRQVKLSRNGPSPRCPSPRSQGGSFFKKVPPGYNLCSFTVSG